MSESPFSDPTGRGIAVVGMAGRFPGGRDLKDFWRNLRDGVEAVHFFSDEELLAAGVSPERLADPHYVKAGSLLEGVDRFDASFFGYSAREAELLDPQQRLFLERAWEGLEDAGYAPGTYEGLIGVYAGAAWNTYLLSNLTTHPELFAGGGGFQVFIASDKDFLPTRVSYKLNLRGPSLMVQTSCSTSLVAVHVACLSLLNYECDLALAGGVTVKVPQVEGYFHQEGGLASLDGHCRAFDAGANGTIFGSGVGVVVLKRLAEALEHGDSVRAVIRGTAINNDGSLKVSYTAPSVEGQAQVIAAAQALAGVEPDTIGYVETHGTGTSLGDPIEVAALRKVFRKSTARRGFCALGSLKTNVGHLDAAAGIGGLIKTVLALEHKQLPPSLNFERPNPALDLDESPFYVNTRLRGWESDGSPRRAGVSSFGVGGTNAHVVLEEAPPAPAAGPSRRCQLLVFSARTETALAASRRDLAAFLREVDGALLPDVAHTLRVGRTVFRHRGALVCRDGTEAVQALEGPVGRGLLIAADTEDPRDRPVVFMFSGQGSQHVNMGRELYEQEKTFREEIDRATALLQPSLGLDLKSIVFPAPGTEAEAAGRLAQTELAQPALFVWEHALARLWMEWGLAPRAMIGHSVGEYVAACLAGVLSVEDALALVCARGRLMQSCAPGRMLAVSSSEEALAPLLTGGLALAAVNEPSGCVVSGPAEAVAGLEAELGRRGVHSQGLHVSHPFHSSAMDPILEPFTREVRRVQLRPPRLPYVSNVTGTWITPEQATDPAYWARHLRETVRFSKGIEELGRLSDVILLEVGPGRTLATLASRQPGLGQLVVPSMRHPRQDGSDLQQLLETLGRLWVGGLRIDWRGFQGSERRRRLPLPTYPFESQRFWIEPAAGPRAAVAATPAAPATKKPDIRDWFYVPSWRSLPAGPGTEGPRAERWLVLVDTCGLGAALVDQLRRDGREVIVLEPGAGFERRGEGLYAVHPGRREDYETLFAELRASDRLPGAVIHGWSLTLPSAPPVTDAEGFEAAQEAGFYSLLSLIQAVGSLPPAPLELVVVSNQAQSVTGAEPVRPEKAPLLGLCRVAALELPHVVCRSIDVALPGPGAGSLATLAAGLIAEVDGHSAEDLVAHRGHERWVPRFEPIRLEAARPPAGPFRQHGVFLLTGGLAGSGFALAQHLARTARARLVLVEGEAADSARKARVSALEEQGAEVLVVTADLTDAADMRRALAEGERRFGALHGVIHAVEVLGEKAFRALAESGRDECAWHFRPKVHALLVLETVLEDRNLDFRVLLSSLATVLGGVAYGAYAAANLFLDAFARDRTRRSPHRWLSLDWDLWQLEGNVERITQVRGDLAELAMTPPEGEEAFGRALSASGAEQILVSTADLTARVVRGRERIGALRARREAAADPSTLVARHPRPPLPNPYVAPESELERRIAAVWERVLGYAPIGVEDNFFELGGDSLVAIQVAKGLQEALEAELPVAQLYQGLTVRALARLLAQGEEESTERRAAQLADRREALDRGRKRVRQRRSARTETEA